ncbi:MAG: hypothetical protein WCP28_12650 [Actinomycetes bacterium]
METADQELNPEDQRIEYELKQAVEAEVEDYTDTARMHGSSPTPADEAELREQLDVDRASRLANLIKQRRGVLMLTQEELSDAGAPSVPTIKRLEGADHRWNPRAKTFRELDQGLQLPSGTSAGVYAGTVFLSSALVGLPTTATEIEDRSSAATPSGFTEVWLPTDLANRLRGGAEREGLSVAEFLRAFLEQKEN